jgi:zinc transporter ZupT
VSRTSDAEPSVSAAPRKRPRGWFTLYALAFVLLLGAAACAAFAARDFLSNLTVLRVSAALSAGAIVLAVLSLVLPRKR